MRATLGLVFAWIVCVAAARTAGDEMAAPFDFHGLFGNYFSQMAKFHADLANHADTYAFTTGGWKHAQAGASISYDTPQSIQTLGAQLQQQQEQLANTIAGNARAPPGQGHAFSYAGPGSGAFASGTIGDGGAYQTAAVYPENPRMPNVVNRYSGDGGGGDAAPGRPRFYGVMTSSSSHATNVDGKIQQQHEAETIINDNGKITKYKVKNP